MKKVAVIGAGGTGMALSAILASRGHEVYFADSSCNQEILEAAREAETIRVSGTVELEGKPALISTDITRAVMEAELIVCCTVSNRDEELARIMLPYVNETKAVLIGAGNGGSILFHRIFASQGKGDVLVAETAGNFFPARITGAGQAKVGLPLAPKGVTAFPPSRSSEAAERFREIWELKPCTSMFEALFNGPNLICHNAGCLMNLAAIDRSGGDFNLFTDGFSPAVLNLTDALWKEKEALYRAMECEPSPPPRTFLSNVMDLENGDFRHFRQMDGPGSLRHRYITEDVPILTCFFLSFARACGVKTPLFEGIVSIISAVNGRDYYAEGRTLENLGYGDLSREELIALFKA